MKKKIVQLVLFFLTLALAFGSWFFLDRAFFSSWQGAPGLSFLFISLFFIILTLDFVVVDNSTLFSLLLIFSLSISLFFVPNIFHLVSLVLAFLLLISGQLLSQMEQKKRINLNFYRIIFPAKFIIVFSLALVISSQYFFVAKDKPVEEVIPQISLGENIVSSKILERGSGFLGLESMTEDSGLSVDEFILDTYVGDRELSSLEKQIILKEGRKNLSQIAKKDLGGDEEMSKVLPTVLNGKINQSLISIAAKNNLPVIQAVLAIALFLAVISLGLIFSRVFIFLASGIFWIMKRGKIVDVKKIDTKKEVLV